VTRTVTVDVSSSTKYKESGVSSPTLSNVAVGDRALVVGTQAGANVVDATSVRIAPAAKTPVTKAPVTAAKGAKASGRRGHHAKK
jgi:hypothetical protein